MLIVLLSVLAGVLLAGIVLDALARKHRTEEMQSALDRIRRRIESTEIVNQFPVLLHELRNLVLDNEELGTDSGWAAFVSEWLNDIAVVEGQPVLRPSWTSATIEALLRDLRGLTVPKWHKLKKGIRGPRGATPAGGFNVVDILALVIAGLSLVFVVDGQRRNEAQFELQRRPWLRIEVTQPLHHPSPLGTARVDFEVTNHGEGSALHCRMVAVVNGTAKPLNMLGALDADASGTLRWTFIPPGASVYSPEGIAARLDTASVAASGDTFVHICAAFDGLETGRRYYTEQVTSWHGSLFARTPEAGPPTPIVYKAIGKARSIHE